MTKIGDWRIERHFVIRYFLIRFFWASMPSFLPESVLVSRRLYFSLFDSLPAFDSEEPLDEAGLSSLARFL